MTGLVLGWLLPPGEREALLALVPPRYARVIAHHVTLKPGAHPGHPLPREEEGVVLGVADDGLGVQALAVSIGGTPHRFDGSTYHITWSLASGRRPVESNAVIARHGWTALDLPRPIRLEPAIFGSGM